MTERRSSVSEAATAERTGTVLESSSRSIPPALIDERLWVLWNGERKTPVAPWASGHLWWAQWNGDLSPDERPEVTYPEARKWADMPLDELHLTHWIPDGEDPHEQLSPTIILPPDGGGNEITSRLTYVDFDDVRDPETGEVSAEAAELIDRLDSYTELSSSETGVHVLIYAELPIDGWINGDDLHDVGSIEIYDHGRFYGGTWNHVDGTPRQINERQDVLDEIVSEYSAHRLSSAGNGNSRASGTVDGGTDGATRGGPASETAPHTSPNASKRAKSPYWRVSLETFAEPDPVERSTSNEKQGAHPVHGKTTSGTTSYNYIIDTNENQWHCFADGSGGGAMEMAAVMAADDDLTDVGFSCELARAGSLDTLTDTEFLRVCLYARDELDGFDDEMDPPYRALVGVAKCCDLPMHDDDRGILGRTTHRYAREIYDDLDVTHDAVA